MSSYKKKKKELKDIIAKTSTIIHVVMDRFSSYFLDSFPIFKRREHKLPTPKFYVSNKREKENRISMNFFFVLLFENTWHYLYVILLLFFSWAKQVFPLEVIKDKYSFILSPIFSFVRNLKPPTSILNHLACMGQ